MLCVVWVCPCICVRVYVCGYVCDCHIIVLTTIPRSQEWKCSKVLRLCYFCSSFLIITISISFFYLHNLYLIISQCMLYSKGKSYTLGYDTAFSKFQDFRNDAEKRWRICNLVSCIVTSSFLIFILSYVILSYVLSDALLSCVDLL